MNFLVLLLIGIIEISYGKPAAVTTPETTTIESTAAVQIQNETSSTEILIFVTPEPEEITKTVQSSTEELTKNSSNPNGDPPTDVQLPVDLLSDDILLDPSVILARATRSVEPLESVLLPKHIIDSLDASKFADGIPTYYFVKFVRVPRSSGPRLVPGKINENFAMPEQSTKTIRRFIRNTGREEKEEGGEEINETPDLHTADDGFIIRPLFKYRQEQFRRSNGKGYRNRDSYSYYPRYPIFPGK